VVKPDISAWRCDSQNIICQTIECSDLGWQLMLVRMVAPALELTITRAFAQYRSLPVKSPGLIVLLWNNLVACSTPRRMLDLFMEYLPSSWSTQSITLLSVEMFALYVKY
jgi:hypothetical protein